MSGTRTSATELFHKVLEIMEEKQHEGLVYKTGRGRKAPGQFGVIEVKKAVEARGFFPSSPTVKKAIDQVKERFKRQAGKNVGRLHEKKQIREELAKERKDQGITVTVAVSEDHLLTMIDQQAQILEEFQICNKLLHSLLEQWKG